MTILHEDPYRLTEVDGVGFARADKIALAADVPPESSRRAQAAAVYALAEAEQQGNSYLPLDELTRRTARLIGLPPDPDVLAEARGPAGRGGRVYRELTHASELAVAATLRDPRRRPSPPRPRPRRDARGSEPDRRAVGGGAGRVRRAGLGPHRRPRRRQDRLHAGDRRRGAKRPTRRSPSAPRPAAPPGGSRKRPATRRRRSTACSSGCRDASRPSGPGTRCRSTW